MVQPEKRFVVGACSASVFVNEITTKDGKGSAQIKSVNLQRVYKDKDGNFQHTNNYQINDIPKAVVALCLAYVHMVKNDGD